MDPITLRFESQKFGPIGRCIYCGADGTTTKLTKEHAIPYSLGRNAELVEASCKKCEGVTRAFEQHCARSILGQFRVKTGIQTRHPDERPTTFPVEIVTSDGLRVQHDLAIADHPSAVVLPIFGIPGIMRNAAPGADWPEGRMNVWRVEHDPVAIARYLGGTNNWTTIATRHRFQVEPFAKLLAKIAHCWSVVSYGLAGFNSFIPDLITGRDPNLGYYVGSDPELGEPQRLGYHEVTTYEADSGYICCAIRLFPDLGSPLYRVVVGTPNRDRMQGYWQQATASKV